MPQKVTVLLTNGQTEEYVVERIEEERNFEHLIGIRLYDRKGLRLILKNSLIKRFDIVEIEEKHVIKID